MPDNNPLGTVDEGADLSDEQVDALASMFDDEETQSQETSQEAETEQAQEEQPETDSDENSDAENDENEESNEDVAVVDEEAPIRLSDGTETTIGELKKHQMLQSDYTRSKQALADERAKFDAQMAQMQESVKAERQQVIELLQSRLPPKPDADMLESDPLGYLQQKEAYDDAVAAIKEQRALSEQENTQTQQQFAAQQQETLRQEQAKMLDAMPHLRDPQKFAEFSSNVSKHMTEDFGFDAGEIGAIQDHRVMRVIDAAIKWQALQANKGAAREAVKSKPPVMRNSPRKGTEQRKSADVAKRLQRAKETGDISSVDDVLGDYMASL